MSEGRWTPSPHVERENAELRRRARGEGRYGVWVAGLSGVVAVFSTVYLVGGITVASPSAMALAALSAVGSGWLTFWLTRRDAELLRRTAEADEMRRGDLGRSVGWLVDLIVVQGDAPTGTDRGMLWIDEGRLCFSGDRTSFALSPNQIAGRCRSVIPISGLRHAVRLPLRHPGLALSIDPGSIPINDLRREIDAWAATAPSTVGQLPPTRLGPGAPSPARLQFRALFSTTYWSVALLLTLANLPQEGAAAGPLALLLLVVGMILRCGYPGTRWRAWHDRRRLGGTE